MAEMRNGRQEDSLETILIESLHILVYEKDINTALNCFLETIGKYYKADRAYIFEFDLRKRTMNNTFEWCAEKVRTEKDRLQNVQIHVIESWIKKFHEKREFYIAALEDDVSQDREDFEILRKQGIKSLMAAPLLWDDDIVGFLGVDNPAEHNGDMLLLRSVVDFVTADLEKRRLIEELSRACCIDMLTGLKNRNEYMRKYNELKERRPETLGVIFIDINGLKQLNDTYGHERGDAMIRKTAEAINRYAPGCGYRIGGDEFIILLENLEEKQFQAKAEGLSAEFQGDGEYSISIGEVWQKENVDIDRQVKEADFCMYEAKKLHYRNRNYDRRKRG
jgi:diguanylate cyclase (GGDEF)-like protein